MERICIEATRSSPYVLIDFRNGLIEFRGRSIMEDSIQFYEPIVSWIKYYIASSGNVITTINIDIEYVNSYGSKIFYGILSLIKTLPNDYVINWIYAEDDEDMFTEGRNFEKLLHMNFKYESVKYINKKIYGRI